MKRLAVVVVLALAACGHATDQRAAIESSVRAYSTDFLGGHAAAAYALLSKRCQAANDFQSYAQAVQGAHVLYGRLAIKSLTVDSLNGSTATVTYRYGEPKIDQAGQRWTLQGGKWKWDAC